MRHLALLAIVAVLAACATTSPPQSRMPFPESEYQALAKTGTGIVRGRAFEEAEGGVIKTAAGNEVILNPVTSYSMEWYEKAYLPGRAMVEADPRLSKYIMTQIVDADGRFTFKNVPPGDYFVTTKITWNSPSGRRGGTISKRITVKDGHETEVMITR
jgi:hypothetical protein